MKAGTGHKELCSAFGPLRMPNIPAHIIIRDIISCLAGPETILAANTLTEVYRHAPSVTGFSFITMSPIANALDRVRG